jgi:WD40 repeat protein
LCFSSNGNYLLAGFDDGTTRLWDITSGACTQILYGHEREINAVAFNPDESMLLTGSGDTTMILWDITTGEEIRTFEAYPVNLMGADALGYAGVQEAVFTPDGNYILSGSNDKASKLWNVETGECVSTYSPDYGAWSLAVSPGGTRFVTGAYAKFALWEIDAAGSEVVE